MTNITQDTNIKIDVENKYDSNITTTKKFTSVKWNMIEKPLSEADRKRNEIIIKLGEDISTNSINELSKKHTEFVYFL